MWSNGFSQNLEIVPWEIKSWGIKLWKINLGAAGQNHLISHVSGLWFVVDGRGEPAEARLVRGWVFGAVAALTLRRADGRQLNALLFRGQHDPVTWRRLLVRLWLPNGSGPWPNIGADDRVE